jgi:acetyl-CoA acetyltransferase
VVLALVLQRDSCFQELEVLQAQQVQVVENRYSEPAEQPEPGYGYSLAAERVHSRYGYSQEDKLRAVGVGELYPQEQA